ncbi:MAG TPA: cupin domain-containing protein, partial [Actinomycetota bacterium]|nr:cupin domain-containing protein [Actinomycetota bacterium]
VDAGGMTVEFGRCEKAVDPTPLFRGLPDDMCQCRHYGYVVTGTYRFRGRDGVSAFTAGEAFLVTPGHIPLPEAGSEWVMFTPTVDQMRTDSVIAANLAAQQKGNLQ